jgi:hypothetical protein
MAIKNNQSLTMKIKFSSTILWILALTSCTSIILANDDTNENSQEEFNTESEGAKDEKNGTSGKKGINGEDGGNGGNGKNSLWGKAGDGGSGGDVD